jgi:hypothetical protein
MWICSVPGRQFQIPADAWMSRETMAAGRYERLGQRIVYKARSSFQHSAFQVGKHLQPAVLGG